MGFWPVVKRAIKDADVVLFILDARLPELSRNKELEVKLRASRKRIFFVFNKIDLLPKKALEQLKKTYPDSFFVSVTKNTGIKSLRVALLATAKKKDNGKLAVGVVGYPNVGKSSVTNILVRAAKTKVSSKAGTTTGLQWASAATLKFIDSPGVVPFDDNEVKLGILNAKQPEKLRGPERVALALLTVFIKNDHGNLTSFYAISIEEADDEYELLLKIGEARNLLKKGGVVDEPRTALTLLRDWQRGKIHLWK